MIELRGIIMIFSYKSSCFNILHKKSEFEYQKLYFALEHRISSKSIRI